VKTLVRFLTAAAAVAAPLVGTAMGQQTASSTTVADRARHDLAMELVNRGATSPFSLQDIDYMLFVIRQDNEPLRLLQQFEDERADKQVGATSSASGTTTLVSKGTVPKIIGVAVENGAVTQSQSGTTVTFRSNVGGAIRAAADKGFFDLRPDNDPALNLLSRLSFSASFDTSRGIGSESNTFTGETQQLSQWTGRLEIVNRRDVQGKEAMAKWQARVFPIIIATAPVRL